MNPAGRVAGKVALITGAARGMGAAHARAMAREGATVAIADIAPEAGERLAAELRGAGGQASYHDHDVTDPAAWHDVVDAVHQAHGAIDVLVNNAGVQMRSFGIEADDDEWAKVTAVNQYGVFLGMRAVIPVMQKAKSGSIVNTSSIAAWAGLPDRALYSASKGAVQALTLAMAADHLQDGIRVNCVNPGTADTPWVQRLLAASDDPVAERVALEARQPIGRLVSAEEVAAAICYLAESTATTGTALAVDGGMQGLRPRR